MKKTIHWILQGKGGVGKSLISSLLFQYYKSTQADENIVGIDTDPNNSTFTKMKSLNVKFLQLLNEDKKIDAREFDKMIEIFFTEQNNTYIIDNGASSFIPLIAYLKENDVLKALTEYFNIVIHVPIVGGEGQEETLEGFDKLVATFKDDAVFIVWINEFFGKVIDEQGNALESMDIYTKNEDFLGNDEHSGGIIKISKPDPQTTGKDLEILTKKHMTIAEAMDSNLPEFNFMVKQRLRVFSKKIYSSLDTIPILNG